MGISAAVIINSRILGTNTNYPHPRLQVFPGWKKTLKAYRKTKNSLAAGIGGWGSFEAPHDCVR